MTQARLPADVRARERAWCEPGGSAAGYAASLRAMGTGHAGSRSGERLREVRTRVLLLAGAPDVKFCAIAHAMSASLRDARVAIVPGAGHAVQPRAS